MKILVSQARYVLSYLSQKGNGIFISIKVKPESKRAKITGIDRDELLIDLHQPPENNKAN